MIIVRSERQPDIPILDVPQGTRRGVHPESPVDVHSITRVLGGRERESNLTWTRVILSLLPSSVRSKASRWMIAGLDSRPTIVASRPARAVADAAAQVLRREQPRA